MGEQALEGGMDPARGVVRIGDTVRRPGMSDGVGQLLQHLEDVGFDAAPRYLGTDSEDRQVVSWVEGVVPLPPYPAWAMTDAALASAGRLVRRYHDAVATFSPSTSDWSSQWADPHGGPVVCHNDLYPENVVFRDGLAVALIDFDMAAPGRALWDLAIVAEEWAPLHAPGVRQASADSLDAVHRIGVLARAYGLGSERAEELLAVIAEERAHSTANIVAQAAVGDPVWSEHVADPDFVSRVAADDAWLITQRSAVLAALRS